jgi:hypothetical protein
MNIAASLVAVSHGMDLITYLWAASLFDASWAESNPIQGAIFAALGLGGVVLVKTAGVYLMTYLVVHRPRRKYLIPAVMAGLIGVLANMLTISRFG